MVKSNLKEEKRLAEKIRKFPYLYDKSDEGYKEKDREKTHGMKWKMLLATKKVCVKL